MKQASIAAAPTTSSAHVAMSSVFGRMGGRPAPVTLAVPIRISPRRLLMDLIELNATVLALQAALKEVVILLPSPQRTDFLRAFDGEVAVLRSSRKSELGGISGHAFDDAVDAIRAAATA